MLDHSPLPAEALQVALDKADDDDDRVWLGRANHALLTGRFADAADWLDRCLRRRPDDPAVWQARLDLALATDDIPASGRPSRTCRPAASTPARSTRCGPGWPPARATAARAAAN